MANPRLLSGAIRKSFFTPICTSLLDGYKPFRVDKKILRKKGLFMSESIVEITSSQCKSPTKLSLILNEHVEKICSFD